MILYCKTIVQQLNSYFSAVPDSMPEVLYVFTVFTYWGLKDDE